MSEALKQRIQEDMKTAMRSQDKHRRDVIRLIQSAIKQREVDERISLDDQQVIGVLEKMLKQRQDSIQQYTQAGRTDLADQEAYEVRILQEYLPQPLTAAELSQLIQAAIVESGATSVKEMGKVMGLLKSQVQGRADMKLLSDQVKQRLSH